MSLNAVATPAALEPGPLVTRCRSLTVAKVDSIGLVVLRWIAHRVILSLKRLGAGHSSGWFSSLEPLSLRG